MPSTPGRGLGAEAPYKPLNTTMLTMPPNSFSARALPRTRWGSLQRSPDTLAGLRGTLLLREWKKGKGKGEEKRHGTRP